ncbi:MAG TPA: Ig-like domain-containing protein [Candidatus Binatia bacterium]|jgi:hypothetical protein|nr:Ig-like domain-containing protein [Candidatus Binatia bacterium]
MLLIDKKRFSALFLMLGLAGSLHAELQVYVANNKNDAQKQPPAGGGNGWLPAGNVGRGVTINAGETIWLACRNSYNASLTKVWDVKLTSTGLPGDLSYDNLSSPEQVGLDPSGAKIPGQGGLTFNAKTGVRGFHLWFQPQPAWERIALKNNAQVASTFTVQASASCQKWAIASSTLNVPTCVFGAVGPGVMATNQRIKQVLVFPKNVAVDPSAPPIFSAPSNSVPWTAFPVYNTPDGSNSPLGGMFFGTEGAGLDPSQACGFSFGMQGPAADLQYTMYAYDEVMAEYQQFEIDLRPVLAISPSNNAVELHFNSVQGLNYSLETSSTLSGWTPLQSISGTGGFIDLLEPMSGPVGFFRLRCAPALPPMLTAISAIAFGNSVTLTFSEPLNGSTANNPGNYFVGTSSGPIEIQNVAQVRPNAIRLILGSPLMPGPNYFLGVMGVSDLSGNVIAPATFQVTAAVLQDPCPGGTLLVQQVYSECNPDGFWHVVEDDYYRCPDGSVQKFRVADTKTTQPCGAAQAVPSPVGLLYPTAADVASTCQSPILVGQVNIVECLGGMWSSSTYLVYQCLDGTKYLSGPTQNVPVNPPTPCDQPPPPPPGAH